MGSLTRFNIRRLAADFGVSMLVETGTGLGHGVAWALKQGLGRAVSCEVHPETAARARARFDEQGAAVEVHSMASADLFRDVIPSLPRSPALVFLDAHFPGADFGFAGYMDEQDPQRRLPLLGELESLAETRAGCGDVVIVDDTRIYRPGAFCQTGECPPFARAWDQERAFQVALDRFATSHVIHSIPHDDGYAVLLPGHAGTLQPYLNLMPNDRPGPMALLPGVPGATCISIQRRVRDARFATRYFVGNGIDVGGGVDSLGLYHELFPLMRNLVIYDQPQGNAQWLENVADDMFDFLYSSHCLEHVADPAEALANWIRVVRPGGHLVVSVPDEDLYEQGAWPSTFNSDHKRSFTLCKRESWSPVSVNVFDLLAGTAHLARPLSVETIDHAFRRGLRDRFDQTRTPLSESAIEFVLCKL